MKSAAGWYLGRSCWDKKDGLEEPYVRESVGYFSTELEAAAALATGSFEVRDCPENNLMYDEGKIPRPRSAPTTVFVVKSS